MKGKKKNPPSGHLDDAPESWLRQWFRAAVMVGTALAFLLLTVGSASAATTSLTVIPTGAGSGHIDGELTAGPEAGTQVIDCTYASAVATGECSATVETGLNGRVALVATPGAQAAFGGWSTTGTQFGGNCNATNMTASCNTGSPISAVTIGAAFAIAELPPQVEMNPVEPEATPPCASGITATSACLSGRVIPEGTELEVCRFEVVPQADPEGFASLATKLLPCEPGPSGIGDEGDPVPVQATATALSPNTIYRVRLLASKPTTGNVTDEAAPFATAPAPPTADTGSAWSVSDTEATLTGAINPQNSEVTDCRFEWGVSEAYGHSLPCDMSPGSGGATVEVLAELRGLSPASTYHFRLLASNGTGGPQLGLDATFTTRARAEVALPARGYELVSTADTNGIQPVPFGASDDGDRYGYATFIPVPGSQTPLTSHFLSTRNPDGTWSQRFVGPAGGGITNGTANFLFANENLTAAVVGTQKAIAADDKNGVEDAYFEQTETGAFTWASRDPRIPAGTPQTVGPRANVAYVSADGGRMLFETARQLLDSAVAGQSSLYEWHSGRLSLVGILPGQSEGSPSGSFLPGGSPGEGPNYNAVSSEGGRVVFAAKDASGRTQLYVRLDSTSTVVASASDGVTPPVASPLNVTYWGADSELNRVFFTSTSALTSDSGASSTSGGVADLYAYDPDGRSLVDLTPNVAGGGAVRQVYDVSADGRRVYFSSKKQLVAGKGVAGESNLYLAQFDAQGNLEPLRFIATVGSREEENYVVEVGGVTTVEAGGLAQPQAWREVSADADGSVLAFRSWRPLVPGRATHAMPQVYVYDAPRDELSCASCSRAPAASVAGSNLVPSAPFGSGLGELDIPGPKSVSSGPLAGNESHVRNVSSDGAVFFQTANQLLPTDTNSKIDVYEFHGGKLALITAGTSRFNAAFAGASGDGSTVFFRAADSLVRGAQDGIQHIYAAKAGVSTYSPPTATPPCRGEDCRGPSVPPPAGSSAVSNGFVGPGNLKDRAKPKSCPNSKLRRGKHCVSKRKLARRICRKLDGRPKQRCIRKQMKRLSKRKLARRICRKLDGRPKQRCIREQMKRLSATLSEASPRTQVRRGHIRSGQSDRGGTK